MRDAAAKEKVVGMITTLRAAARDLASTNVRVFVNLPVEAVSWPVDFSVVPSVKGIELHPEPIRRMSRPVPARMNRRIRTSSRRRSYIQSFDCQTRCPAPFVDQFMTGTLKSKDCRSITEFGALVVNSLS
jgi:hypothetical protein